MKGATYTEARRVEFTYRNKEKEGEARRLIPHLSNPILCHGRAGSVLRQVPKNPQQSKQTLLILAKTLDLPCSMRWAKSCTTNVFMRSMMLLHLLLPAHQLAKVCCQAGARTLRNMELSRGLLAGIHCTVCDSSG